MTDRTSSGHMTSQFNRHSSLLACHVDWFNQVHTFLLPLASLCCFVAVQVKDREDQQRECVFEVFV